MKAALQTQTQAPAPLCFTPVQAGLLQRKCACGGSPGVAGQCEKCSEQGLSLQRKAQDSENENRNSTGVPPIVSEVLNSPGQPLDAETRAFMEPRLGHDFGHVRIHTDARSVESAAAVNGLAYTVGRDVVFGAGEYAPNTAAGRRLLSHELTHVVQQDSGAAAGSVSIGHESDQYEQEAEQVADQLEHGRTLSIASGNGRRLSLNGEPQRLWGGFRIYGEPDYVSAIRAHLNQLNGTTEGAAILGEITEYTKPFYRSYISISPSSACGFLPGGIYFPAAGCSISNNCSGSTSAWTNVPAMVYLYHEIVHAYIYYIMDKGTDPDRECMTTGLGHYFSSMKHSENKLRCELGLPIRPCYDGECRLAAPTCAQRTGERQSDVGATQATMNRPWSTPTAGPAGP